MKKPILIFLFLLSIASAFGQKVLQRTPANPSKKSIVTLVRGDKTEATKDATGKSVLIVHNGLFKQDFSTLTSDSAYFYQELNMVDAFGHVHINQGDTLNIYSDKLNYNGNTKLAILTNHVIMVDKDATLTTNYLTYNTATRIGIYNDGGKLVNKDNTLTSKNGYYFALTHDAYFRYNVICNTTDAIIKTDTLKYNTKVRITYFYGPTHILGKKDKDTLYTENGTYNTINEQARFGKKNLYTQGTKSLKGDSLYYDRLQGYGRAVKNITFNDNEQKITIKGDLGEYYKADDNVVVTQNAYMIIVTEDKDSTKTDSVSKRGIALTKKDSLRKKADSVTIKRLGLVPAAKLATDTATIKRLGLVPVAKLATDTATIMRLGLVPAVKAKTDSLPVVHIGPPDVVKSAAAATKKPVATTKTKTGTAPKTKDAPAVKSISKITPLPANKGDSVIKPVIAQASDHIKLDSMFVGADTLETRILTYKDYKILQRERWEASHRDTSIKVVHSVMLTKAPKVLTGEMAKILADTGLFHPEFFGKPKPKAAAKKKPTKPIDPKKLIADSIKKVQVADSLQKIYDHGLVDTSRIRIISGHHHAKIFKSDLQAKSDSLFYSYSDSTIRMFVHPIIWTQGAQLSGDTITMQMKNRKLDNMDLFPSALIVYIEKNDSTHFNQAGGKTMHGTFKDNKLSTMLVVGNTETIAFKRDSATNKVTEMSRSVSGTGFARFGNGVVTFGAFTIKYHDNATPIAKVKEEDKTLKAFIWKPKERPASKMDIIASYKPPVEKKPEIPKNTPVKGTMPVKPVATKTNGNKKTTNTVVKPATITPEVLKPVKDTTLKVKPDSLKKPDTLKKVPAAKPKGENQ